MICVAERVTNTMSWDEPAPAAGGKLRMTHSVTGDSILLRACRVHPNILHVSVRTYFNQVEWCLKDR